jgi:hypothetical protein
MLPTLTTLPSLTLLPILPTLEIDGAKFDLPLALFLQLSELTLVATVLTLWRLPLLYLVNADVLVAAEDTVDTLP